MSWKPIVVGVDASEAAAGAAALGHRMAVNAATRCQLVHAASEAWTALAAAQLPDHVEKLKQGLAEQARHQIGSMLQSSVPADLLQGLVLRFGRAPVVLQDVARELDAELVVLGGKRHSLPGRWFGGSTCHNAIRTVRVPVLVSRGAPTGIRRILVAVDLSGVARPTLAAAERYAALFGAELRALNVLEPLPVIPGAPPVYDMAEYYALTEELLRRDIWPLIQTQGVEKVTRHGMAVETILREVTEWQADLLVVGSHGRGWAERMLLGSVTELLLNHLPTSLVVVPVPAAPEALQSAEAGLAAGVA
ncbi:MAG TPA: universal stress protein [Gemmatimonadales bacterium]|nr:universal stress protein [Gemmatimonadales bacterium]